MESLSHFLLGDADLLSDFAAKIVRAILWLVLGFAGAGAARRLAIRMMATEGEAQRGVVYGRVVSYLLYAVTLAAVLKELGFDLSVLLGAAGIVTVAVGFASQTSASNFISGIFLIAEKPFRLGDFIKVEGTMGTVLSIDTLSIKLRTLDNLFVRIPNEQVIKAQVTNYSRFDIRRVDLPIGVAYREDLERVQAVLLAIAAQEHQCMAEPEPTVILTGFGDSSINLEFRVWTQRVHLLDVRNLLYRRIKARFDEEGIEIPFPHLSLYAGSVSKPIEISLRSSDEEKTEGDGGDQSS